MESTEQERQGRTAGINLIPDEVLLEVFDSYRQSVIGRYCNLWREEYLWLNLAHVCRRWRAVMFASSSRLDLNVTVGPKKPDHIKTILSGHLPIIIDYDYFGLYRPGVITGDIIGSAHWRMRAALGHRDRVREILVPFEGHFGVFKKFIRATTNHHFPALENLVLYFSPGYEPDLPATFLRGPGRSDLPLRRLEWYGGSFTSVSRLLLSATALTNLTLNICSIPAGFDRSQGSHLLACLRGTQCLSSLNLTTPYIFDEGSQFHYPTPKDIVPLSKLARLLYSGSTTFLNDFMSELSAPSLQDARFQLRSESPLLYLSRAIDDLRGEFRSVSVSFDRGHFCLLSSTHLGEIDHSKPASFEFKLSVNRSPHHSINPMIGTPPTKFAMVEELTLNSHWWNLDKLGGTFPRCSKFLRLFRGVRLLRLNPFVREVGVCLWQEEDDDDDDGEAIFPVLERVELSISHLTRYSDEGYQDRAAEALATFGPCERAGRAVKVCHSEQTEAQSRNARCIL